MKVSPPGRGVRGDGGCESEPASLLPFPAGALGAGCQRCCTVATYLMNSSCRSSCVVFLYERNVPSFGLVCSSGCSCARRASSARVCCRCEEGPGRAPSC